MYRFSRADTFAKLFFIVSFIGLFMYIVLAFYTFHSAYISMSQTKRVQKKIQRLSDTNLPLKNTEDLPLRYILLWTIENNENPIGEGQEPFLKYDCLHQNCHITTNKGYLNDYTDFHAIVFNATSLKRWNRTLLPARRSWDQKYVFYGKVSSENIPLCNIQADTFFNWTWSYKLYSDILSPFFEVKNLQGGSVVAPNPDVHWPTNMYDDEMNVEKTTKKKAMAVILRKCDTYVGKQKSMLAKTIQTDLKKNSLIFDIYGCGNIPCLGDDCLDIIKRDYFFYWVNEGSFAEDYVTGEVLTAIQTNTVPIVFGGADYTKFLPTGSYIDARRTGIEMFTGLLFYIMRNPDVYNGFFRWKKLYTIQASPEFKGLCKLCSDLNNKELMERHAHYELFRKWWYPGPLDKRCGKMNRNMTNAKENLSF